MAIALASMIAAGFQTAKALVPDAFEVATVRLGPTSTVDPVAGTAVTTWTTQNSLATVFGFDDAEERKTLPLETRQRTFLVNPGEFGAGAVFDQNGEVEVDGTVWEVYRVELAPGGKLATLYARS